MQVIHNLGALNLKKNIDENAGFLLTNKRGSYCSFFSFPSSRYHGLFCFDEEKMKMYKFIENIEIAGKENPDELKNNFYSAQRRKYDVVESYLMPANSNSLVYELSSENEIDLILDCKDSYDNREWGRHYEISEEDGIVIVKFTKKTDRREDSSDGAKEFAIYLAIKSGNGFYQKNDRWIERNYSFDEERKSMPYKRHVYSALRLKGSKFVFSMSGRKNSAKKESGYIFGNLPEIKKKEKEDFINFLRNGSIKKIANSQKISDEVKIAYINAMVSLNNLAIKKKNCGLFAGLPWFFQFWSRDTMVSLGALGKIDNEIAKKIIFNHLNKINYDGRLPNLAGRHESIGLGNADAHGWLFFRCKELVDKIESGKKAVNSIKYSINHIMQDRNADSPRIKDYLKKCSFIVSKKEENYHSTMFDMESSAEKSLNGLLKFHTKGSFETNGKLETWMDTSFENDAREGARIEIQALRLNMYRLLLELTQNHKYRILENLLKQNIRKKFWNRQALADGLDDFTVRPNIFIAAYIYPELLAGNEWETCFENALEKLWLEWGGLATIDKSHPLFCETHTGEDNKSYHRGDSWFWVNNLAGVVLSRMNKDKFKENIQKIIEASTEEILWKGCVGCHSEISSAKELSSKGCFNQAWSNAMYIEMIDEVFR